MERLLGFAINDTSFLSTIVKANSSLFDIDRGLADGGWGLGVHRYGEVLVQKRRISASIDGAAEVINSASRHVVLHAAPRRPGLFELEHVQPYRYRNWLFASVGALGLPQQFIQASAAELKGFTAEGRWMSCPAESAMLIFMHAFHRLGELDRTRVHTRVLRRALAEGASDLMALLGHDSSPNLAFALHVRDYTYALSLGRPLGFRHLRGAERVPTRSHVRALAFTSDPAEGWGELIPPWSMLEIGPQGQSEVIALQL